MEKSREDLKIESLVKRIVKLEKRVRYLEGEIKTKASKQVVYGK